MPDDDNSPISTRHAKGLFADWKGVPAIILAVSGGPDSIALMWLAARWRRALTRGPRLIAVTVDHGLRPEAAAEARGVKRLARSLDLPHRTLRWTGPKPRTGLPAAARAARYRLLAQAARSRGDGARVRARWPAAGTPVPGYFEIAAHRDTQESQDRLRRRSDQPRHQLHASASAHVDAGSRRRGRRYPQSGAARLAACPRKRCGGSVGRWRRALSRAQGSPSLAFGIQRRDL